MMRTMWLMEKASDQNNHSALWERSPSGWANKLSCNYFFIEYIRYTNKILTFSYIITLYPKKSTRPPTTIFLIIPLNMSIIRLPLKVSSLGRLLANCASVTVELSCYAKSLINGTSHILVRNGAPYNYYCIVMHWTHNSVNDSSRLQTTGQARARAGPGREGIGLGVLCSIWESILSYRIFLLWVWWCWQVSTEEKFILFDAVH